MTAFDDCADPELDAACNRLAAWANSLPAGALIDDRSGLTEHDLGLILRHLHATRWDGAGNTSNVRGSPWSPFRTPVPTTAQN